MVNRNPESQQQNYRNTVNFAQSGKGQNTFQKNNLSQTHFQGGNNYGQKQQQPPKLNLNNQHQNHQSHGGQSNLLNSRYQFGSGQKSLRGDHNQQHKNQYQNYGAQNQQYNNNQTPNGYGRQQYNTQGNRQNNVLGNGYF